MQIKRFSLSLSLLLVSHISIMLTNQSLSFYPRPKKSSSTLNASCPYSLNEIWTSQREKIFSFLPLFLHKHLFSTNKELNVIHKEAIKIAVIQLIIKFLYKLSYYLIKEILMKQVVTGNHEKPDTFTFILIQSIDIYLVWSLYQSVLKNDYKLPERRKNLI